MFVIHRTALIFDFLFPALGCVTQLVWARGTLSLVGRFHDIPNMHATQHSVSRLSAPSVSGFPSLHEPCIDDSLFLSFQRCRWRRLRSSSSRVVFGVMLQDVFPIRPVYMSSYLFHTRTVAGRQCIDILHFTTFFLGRVRGIVLRTPTEKD